MERLIKNNKLKWKDLEIDVLGQCPCHPFRMYKDLKHVYTSASCGRPDA